MTLRSGFCFCLALTAAFPADRLGRDQHFFDTQVAPILTKRCLGCHNQQLNNGGLSFQDRESLLKGGGRGPVIVPGRPESSVLVKSLQHDGDLQMPPGPKLPVREIRVLTEWIRRGAVWGKNIQAR